MRDRGVDFADIQDATAAAMWLSCDSSINGTKHALTLFLFVNQSHC